MGKNLIVKGLIILLAFLVACQPTPSPTLEPPPPTPILIPPIQRGDGSDVMDRLLDKGIIRVGIRVWPEAEFSPPAFRGASNALTGGALNGFEVDLARHVAEQLGLELELVEAYPPVIAAGDWRGEWDIALASLVPFDNPNNIPTSKIFYSQPYGYMPMGILTPVGSNIQSIAQLEGRRVGVLEHSSYQRLLTPENESPTVYGQQLVAQPFPPLQLIVVSNLQKAIRQLGQPVEKADTPQLDAIFGPTPLFQEAIKTGLPLQLAAEAKNIGVQPLVIAAVPQNGLKVDRLLAEINTALDRLQRQGVLSEIYLQWYEQDLSQLPGGSG
jgi:polar amino acid transport system substrate-binding protein